MLQKKIYNTSTTRFANLINLIDYEKIKYKLKLKKHKMYTLHKKIFSQIALINPTNNVFYHKVLVLQYYVYNKKPYKSFIMGKNLYNQEVIVPHTEYTIPGIIINNYTTNLIFKKNHYINSIIYLKDLPYYLNIVYLTNQQNKLTFVKSSGTFATKLKGKKTIKFYLVKLPSDTTYYFTKYTKGYIGKNNNYFMNKFIEGKWGFSLHKTKHISVRGVAMNPVDHPNGGRTKAKQPEKSPWGWIAKHNK